MAHVSMSAELTCTNYIEKIQCLPQAWLAKVYIRASANTNISTQAGGGSHMKTTLVKSIEIALNVLNWNNSYTHKCPVVGVKNENIKSSRCSHRCRCCVSRIDEIDNIESMYNSRYSHKPLLSIGSTALNESC